MMSDSHSKLLSSSDAAVVVPAVVESAVDAAVSVEFD